MKEKLRNFFHAPSFKGGDSHRSLEASVSPCETPALPETPTQLPAATLPPKISFTSVMQEQLDLRLASAETPTVVLELDLDGVLRYVSKSWEQLVGTSIKKILNKPIANIIIGTSDADLSIFNDAMDHMIRDNASYKVKFVTSTNDLPDPVAQEPEAVLVMEPATLESLQMPSKQSPLQSLPEHTFIVSDPSDAASSSTTSSKISNDGGLIELEAQGILIYSPTTKEPTHSIWTVRPFERIDVDLTIPPALVDLLGFGSEIFEGYLVSLREAGIIDEDSIPEPKLFLCRICELNFPAWFIEKHSSLCLLEHKVEEELQFCHDHIADQRHLIAKISDSLWCQQIELSSGPSTPNSSSSSLSASSASIYEYKGIALPSMAQDPSNFTRASTSSRNADATFQSSRKFPFGILSRLMDYCDEALLMNAAERLESREGYAFSPTTEGAINTVLNWQSLETSDPAIRAIVDDTKEIVTEKVNILTRLLSILQYSDKIKQEVDELVLKAVTETVSKIREITRQHEVPTLRQRTSIQNLESLRGSSPLIDPSYQPTLEAQNKSLSLIYISPTTSITPASPTTQLSLKIHSPQPSRLRSPSARILDEEVYKGPVLQLPMASFTPRDILNNSSPMLQSRLSLSPGTTSASLLPTKNIADSLEALTLSNKSSEAASLHSSLSSPRRKLSPTPYVEKLGLSTLQKNTNAVKPISSPHISSEKSDVNRSRRNLVKKSISSSSLVLPALENPTNLLHSPAIPSTMNPASSSHQRSSFSSSKPPLSPLLVSQPSVPKSSSGGIKDYEIIKAISKGAYGSVFLARKKLTGDYVAIKCLRKGDMIAKNQILNVRSERAVMIKQTDSPYVAQLYSSFQSKDYLYLVMEYLNGGDCATLLKMLGTLENSWARRYIAEVIVGVDDLHKRQIIHRDLKPDNLLIDGQGHIKLTDFGLSRMGVVGRHTFRHRKSSASEHGIELFRKSIHSTSTLQSPSYASAIDSPELVPIFHRRNPSVTPFSLSPSLEHYKAGPSSHGHLNSVSSHESATGGTVPAAKKRSISQLRTSSSNRSGSLSSGMDSPNLKPLPGTPLSESSFAIVDDEFAMSPNPNEDSFNSYTLFDPASEDGSIKKFVGTPDYLAPETITGDRQGEYSDWWSIGCILFEFLYGYPPFHAECPERVFENILSGEIDWPPLPAEEDEKICPPPAKDLIRGLLKLDYEERLGFNGAEEIMCHPYFENIDWANLYLETPDSFIPAMDGPDSTDYFDLRGADISQFPKDDSDEDAVEDEKRMSTEGQQMQDLYLSLPNTPNSIKRERRGSKLTDPSEFGSFNYKNLNVLEKANKDVIQRLKSEHMEHRNSFSSSSSETYAPNPSKSRGLSFSSAVVSLGSPFKRPVSPAPSSGSGSPNKGKLQPRMGLKRDSSSNSSMSEGRPRTLVPSLSKQIFLRTANELMLSPSSSDTEDSSSALFRVQRRRESLRHTNSSGSGSSQGTNSFLVPLEAEAKPYLELDVLYCEPIPIVRHTVSKLMEKLGCVVLSISDGDDLIRRAKSKVKFDLIFTALRLPKVEAVDAVKLIKYTSGVNSLTPIIAITGFAKEAIDLAVFDDVLEKPIDAPMLQSVIDKFQIRDVAVDSEPET